MTTAAVMTYGPDLSSYYKSLTTNTTYRLQAKTPWYMDVGTGTFSALSANHLAFNGKIDTVFYKGSVSLDLQVTGPMTGTIGFNGKTEPCSFSISGSDLIVHLDLPGKKNTTLNIEWWHSGLWIGGPGTPHDIWVGP